jgi:hypothetical protein
MNLRIRSRLAIFEAWLALALAWVLVFVVPFRRTAAWLGNPARPGATTAVEPAGIERARHVCRRVAHVAPGVPWRTTCLVQAVAGVLLLKRRRIAATIRLGVKQIAGERGGGLAAHAWLIVGGETVLGGAAAEDFSPLADLG